MIALLPRSNFIPVILHPHFYILVSCKSSIQKIRAVQSRVSIMAQVHRSKEEHADFKGSDIRHCVRIVACIDF